MSESYAENLNTANNQTKQASKEPESIDTPLELRGEYQIIELLGEGANGKTYLARATYSNKLVAIKCLKMNQVDNLKSVELFKREAEVLQSIDVPGVPKYYSSIIPENGQGLYFIIQEYIKYPSLDTLLAQKGKLPELLVIKILKKLCNILSALQEQYVPPIIHRDIKPSNILINKLDENVDVYLIDFGAVANPQKHQGGSTIAGTFGYMAPEQQMGDVEIQSDYYAVGATALHLLTGVMPYEIEADVFNLKFGPVLDQHAPDTTPAMRELLSLLLATDINRRPKDVVTLRHYIQQVEDYNYRYSVKAKDNGMSKTMTMVYGIICAISALASAGALLVMNFGRELGLLKIPPAEVAKTPTKAMPIWDSMMHSGQLRNLAIISSLIFAFAVIVLIAQNMKHIKAFLTKIGLRNPAADRILKEPQHKIVKFQKNKKYSAELIQELSQSQEDADYEAQVQLMNQVNQSHQQLNRGVPQLVALKNLWKVPSQWQKCAGKVLGQTYIKQRQAFEYIFEVSGESFVGASGYYKGHNLRFPLECEVAYDPKDPKKNVLTDIKL